MDVKYLIDAETSSTWRGVSDSDVDVRGWKMAVIREGTDWITAGRAESITRLNPHTHNGNGYGVQKCFSCVFLRACLQVELSTLKRYFIKDKIRSIEPGGDNYSPDGRRHAIDSLYVVRAGRRHRLQPEGVSQTSYPLSHVCHVSGLA